MSARSMVTVICLRHGPTSSIRTVWCSFSSGLSPFSPCSPCSPASAVAVAVAVSVTAASEVGSEAAALSGGVVAGVSSVMRSAPEVKKAKKAQENRDPKDPDFAGPLGHERAGDGIRTHDIHVGNVTL